PPTSTSVAPRRCPVVSLLCCVLSGYGLHCDLLSFPTRRSSDLSNAGWRRADMAEGRNKPAKGSDKGLEKKANRRGAAVGFLLQTDRKSTRLNSSHQIISYAVFCLKKKKNHRE